ncbi:MAG: InlB B-repeat-containing protein [Bacteroidales bacterium]|nr:InlB B-repeat-containing protein [Bacteroidales bacterium]
MKKQFALIAWITLIMTLLLSSCQKFEEDAIQKLAYGKDESGRHFVDLGLSVKWATCNIGAEAPEQQGLLYAWGETTPKEEYTWDNYKFGPDTALSKYCANPDVAWHGFTDTKTTLELSDDAAHVNWQGRWRMPTQAEWNELIEKCTWAQTEYMGVKGYDVKAANGNRIFLPAPDENALYASSSLLETRPGEALHLPIFDQYDVLTAQYRYRAYSVRAVYGPVLPQYCLITFDANGGEGIMHPQQFSKGALIPLTEVRFTKQASVFSSWNTKADGSGASYKDKASIITDKSFTIYAQWTPCYTITFDANGGEGTMDSLTIVSGTKKPLPANTFMRSGYVFAGWNTKADGSGTAYKESSEIAPTENMTLYAQWTPCYTITFDANGGEGTMDSLTIVSGTKKPLPANTFTRSGYVFAGWNTAPD